MERRDEAYVLRTQELAEADLIVTLLAEHHGKVRGVARSARRSQRRFGGGLAPLTHVRAQWDEREGRELHRIEGLECVRSFAPMQAEPVLQAACAVLAELAESFSHEGQSDPRAARLLGAVLAALEAGLEPWTAVRYFEYWTLRLHGILPDWTVCAGCGRELGRAARGRVEPHGAIACAGCATP
ncbi:MAG TPA: DNA repair protein RecO, partial [Candidatus Polarisedimenticolaceae bacterium]|nr:DNA repair protein RecO [Candidatus Polarisedimenticolaceae bacterium]